ncbi:MAG: dockerin type I domain-containing protein [Candidatus Aceula lacicola]|nr:dockerin type I domain-containing protein [Candidatus Aceula lacicola]
MKKILFILFAFFLFFASNVFADDVTLTTYYPAPFGMYQEMRVMGKLGVGTTIPVASLDVAGSIISDGGSGDVDGSGTLTEQDAQLIKLYVAVGTNFTRKQIAEADVDGNGRVSLEDATMVRMMMEGGARDEVSRMLYRVTRTQLSGTWPSSMQTSFSVHGNLGVGTSSPDYAVQVGIPTGSAPTGSDVSVAIKDDLWVDGRIYSAYGGEWERNETTQELHPTDIGDTVIIGAVSYSEHLDKGLIIISSDSGDFGIYQTNPGDVNSTNYFCGTVGIGQPISHDISEQLNPSLFVGRPSYEGAEARNEVLLLVGTGNGVEVSGHAVPKIGATASIWGTLGVTGASVFGNVIRAYQNVQLVPFSQDCVEARYGEISFSWPTGGTKVALKMCAPCYNDPVKCPGWTGGATWVSIGEWKAFSGSNPDPGVLTIELPPED